MSLEGKIIGNRYEVLEKIGIGGMATVYKAKDNILKRNVAVKVLRDEFTTDEEFIKRFNTEAQAAASLTHPNIVSIYDVGHEDNLYFIVMELIQGKTLKQIITEDGVALKTECKICDLITQNSEGSMCITPVIGHEIFRYVSHVQGNYISRFATIGNYLATINNLSQPVTKTADKTMKVTYVIQETT